MSSPLKQNTTTIQELLNAINNLPEAENLDAELSTQATLLSEQDAKIAKLAQVLAGKAGGGSELSTQEKTVEITKNGNHEILPDDGYALSKVTAVVDVPVPDGYIQPSGTMEVTENGTHDVTEYASVDVNVATGGISVDDIASCAIEGDINLTVNAIQSGAFWGNNSIKSINAPNVTTIGERGVYSCQDMTEINAPELQSIGTYGLGYCYDLTTLDFPKLETVGTYAFYYCSGVQGDIVFPAVTKLPTQSLCRMSNITSIDLPVCTNIADQVFRYCSKLNTIILRSSTLCTLGNINTFYNTPFASGQAGGKLYVPAALVESYKTATNWSTILGYATNEIRAIEDYPDIYMESQ